MLTKQILSAIDMTYFLARHSSGKYVTKHLASYAGVTLMFAEQTLMRLRKAGFITSYRGQKGGYAINPAVPLITALDIYKSFAKKVSDHKTTRVLEQALSGQVVYKKETDDAAI